MHQRIADTSPANWTYNFDLPLFSPAGNYRLEIKAHDAVKGTEAALTPVFTVEAATAAPAAELELRGFQFSATEDGPAQEPMVLAPGGTLHMSAQIAGIQFVQDKPNTVVGLQVMGPAGEKIADAPRYVEIVKEEAYHPPTFFVKMNGWIRLPGEARRGTYTARYTIDDAVASKKLVHVARFQVQ